VSHFAPRSEGGCLSPNLQASFLQCQEIKVKTRDSRPRNHQAIYLRYRSFKRGGVSELNYAQSEDRSQATSFLPRSRTVTATVSSPGLINTQFPKFVPSHIKTKAVARHCEPGAVAGLTGRASSPLSGRWCFWCAHRRAPPLPRACRVRCGCVVRS
jgi:hypothetical protein